MLHLIGHMPLTHLELFDWETGDLQVVVETAKGKRNRIKYDESHGVFRVSCVLPGHMAFPCDLGFVPSTLSSQGGPLEALIFMDESAPPGCVIRARPIGMLRAKQTGDGGRLFNDLLIVIAAESQAYGQIQALEQIGTAALAEIEQFFTAYAALRGDSFKPLAWADVEGARHMVVEAVERFWQKYRFNGEDRPELSKRSGYVQIG